MTKRRIFKFAAVLISVFILSVSSLYAKEESITVLSFLVPKLMISETEGTFVLITREVEQRTGLKFDIIFRPTKRAVEAFKAGYGDMLFPAVEGIYNRKEGIIQSEESFFTKRDYIFTLKTNPVLRSVKELKNKNVGILRGYLDHCFSKEIKNKNRDFYLEEANTLSQNAKKLQHGRIDAFVGEEIAILGSFEKTDMLNNIHYDKNAPIAISNTYYVFRDTDHGRSLEQKVSKALKGMKADGTYENIMRGGNSNQQEK